MSKWYFASNVTPADNSSVQEIPNPGDYTELETGDKCFCHLDGRMRVFQYYSTSSTPEDSPFILTPTGNTGDGRWHMEEMSTAIRFFHGVIGEHFDATVTSNGSVVTMSIEAQGGGDLTAIHTDRRYTVDCTPAATLVLTPGADAAPTSNYVYILESAPATLALSTSNWPTANHIKIAYFLVPSATYVQAHGCYVNQNWNDGTNDDETGHLAHITENIRLTLGGANWHSGVAGNGATSGYITVDTGDTPDSVYFKSTSGVCYQMHRHSVPAFDQETEDILFVNSDAGAYTPRGDIADETVDATGATLNNKYYNIVFWMVANKSGEYAPVMANMPSGSYVNATNANVDADGYDVYDIPREYNQESACGFLVCRITFRNQAGNVSVISTTDLRGRTPGSASGSVPSGTTEFADNQFKIFDEADDTKIVDFYLNGITTGNTRTITPADADMTLLSTTNHDDLTDGGDTTLHDHDGIDENTAARHAESHTVASHNDTTATGAELDELTDGGDTDLHQHDSLVDDGEVGVTYTTDGAVSLNHDGSQALRTQSQGVSVIDPADSGNRVDVSSQSGNAYVAGKTNSMNVRLASLSSTGAFRDLLIGEPDGATKLYNDGGRTLQTESDGVSVTPRTGNNAILYLGGTTTEGSWRFYNNGTDLLIQRYESSTWVTKSTISS